ncbi:hypothetical protein H4582DRAFT_2064925 [Lactarius indigo]|nr:hypothetical protein H4582DRAFT_2064925 [Lactarius indigo]
MASLAALVGKPSLLAVCRCQGRGKRGKAGVASLSGPWRGAGPPALSFAGVEATPWVSRVREPLAPARAFAGSVSVWPVLPPLWANRHYSPSVDGQSWLVEAGEEESGARREWQASRVLGMVRVHQLSLLRGLRPRPTTSTCWLETIGRCPYPLPPPLPSDDLRPPLGQGRGKRGKAGVASLSGPWRGAGPPALSFAGVEATPWVSRVREPLAPARAFAGSVSVWPVLPPLWANRHYSPSVDGQSWLVEAGEEESGARREWQASRVLGVARVHQFSLLCGLRPRPTTSTCWLETIGRCPYPLPPPLPSDDLRPPLGRGRGKRGKAGVASLSGPWRGAGPPALSFAGVETSLGDLDLHTGDHGVDAPTLLCPLTTLDRPLGAGHDSESEWRGLADKVNGYISIAGDDRGDDPHQCEEAVEKRELDADDLAVEPNSVAERR